MELIEYLRAVRRHKRVVAAALVVALAAAWLTDGAAPAVRSSDVYEARSLIFDIGGTQPPVFGAGGSIQTLAVLATIEDVTVRAANDLGSNVDPQKLAARVTATADSETGILSIAATARKPAKAERIAGAFARALLSFARRQQRVSFHAQIDQVRQQLNRARITDGPEASETVFLRGQLATLVGQANAPLGLTIIDEESAQLVSDVSLPGPGSGFGRVLFGALAGLVLGIALALVLDRVDRRIRTSQAAEEHFTAPVIAEIPVMRRRHRGGLAMVEQPLSAAADSFRLLAAGLLHSMDGNGSSEEDRNAPTSSIVMITSGAPNEGKSTLAVNLASAYAELGKVVLVISCDLRRPTAHRVFHTPAEPGLTNALTSRNGVDLGRYVQNTSLPNVGLIPSGPATHRPGELLASARMRDLLDQSRRCADVVILDTPAILVASDVACLIPEVDAVLIVARAGVTRADLAERTSRLLRRLGAPVVGIALNQMGLPQPSAYRWYRVGEGDGAEGGPDGDETREIAPAFRGRLSRSAGISARPERR